MEDSQYSIENYASGFIVADYSGKRGQYGAAYTGEVGEWKSQPVGISDPFKTKLEAERFIAGLIAGEQQV